MAEDFYLGAYWGGRKESAQSCGERAEAFLRGLAERDPLFTRWYQPGRSRKEALRKEVPLRADSLEDLFFAGRARRDTDRTVIRDLGYRIYLWTELTKDEGATLSIKCGGWSKSVPNSCVLRFPEQGECRERLLQTRMVMHIIKLTAECWDPDWATINSSEFRELSGIDADVTRGGVYVGWILYLSSRLNLRRLQSIPAPSKLVSVEGKGVLIVTTEERFSSANPQHAKQAMKIIAALRTARLVRG